MHINSLINIGIGFCLTAMGASVLGVKSLSLPFVGLIIAGQGIAWMPDITKKSISLLSSIFPMSTTLTNRVSATTLHTSSNWPLNDDPVELEDKAHSYENSASDIDPLINRAKFVETQIKEGMERLGIHKKFSVVYDMDSEDMTPSVTKKGRGFEIKLPLLFLLEADDFNPSSPCHDLIKNLDQEFLKYLPFIKDFWKNEELAHQAKRFLLFHELAHVALGHIYTIPLTMEESRIHEKQADLVAAEASGAAEGGAYFFDLSAQYFPTNCVINAEHPPDDERASYLREYLRSK